MRPGDHNILDYGAVADGKTKCTEAFARAIETCAAAHAGGGRVIVPRGTFLTGPIRLKSNINLHVERGALVMFSRDYDDYEMVLTDYEGEDAVRCISPIWGEELQNVSITGQGIFDGQGEAWRPVKKWKRTDEQWAELLRSGGAVDEEKQIWWPSASALAGEKFIHKLQKNPQHALKLADYLPARQFLRPNMVKFSRCSNVVLDGPTFRNSAAWNVHMLLCDAVTIKNVTILNPWYATNGDALDLDSCRNVTVSDSLMDAGDDAICIKSGKDEPARRRGRPCENISISNCTVLRGHGGVTIGSEMSGGVRNVRVSNCTFKGTDIGLRFKSKRGRGGVVDNVDISNITMADIRTEAISINMYYGPKNVDPHNPHPVNDGTPVFRNIYIRNIACQSAKRAIEIRGLPEMPVQDVLLENVHIVADHGAILSDTKNIFLSHVRIEAKQGPALQCNNVSNIKMDNVDGVSPPDPVSGAVGML